MAEALSAVAEVVAARLRPPLIPVDPTTVASTLGVVVERRSMAPSVLGATPSHVRIVINQGLTHTLERFVVAHELAHVLVKRGLVSALDQRAEEQFADTFAAALLVPAHVLGSVVDVEDVAGRLRVDSGVVRARAEQLGRAVTTHAA
jgi:Zn-dependent peptidase ImmA (M78 family)